MYLRECLIENVGPIENLDISMELNDQGNPKPVILVGKNGVGKTILLAYILDALAELAKKKFEDIARGQQIGNSPYFKVSSRRDTRSLCGNSLSLLEFSDTHNNKFCYIEKFGQIDPQHYLTKMPGRFETVQTWPESQPFYKMVTGDEKQIETFFQSGAVCFFPASRHECPHWLNFNAIENKPLFATNQRSSGMLSKPLIVERSAEDNQQWLMDVLLDSLVDVELVPFQQNAIGELQWQIPPNIMYNKYFLKIGRENVEKILRAVIEDNEAKILLNHRNFTEGRVAILLKNGVIVPSFMHLSAGQALLFNLFATIIRYGDRGDISKSIRLNELSGIVLIDEIDAHLHTYLQYEVLPKLIKLFPKVQFIMTSHAPLFMLGMEREFGTENIQILEMPTGKQTSTERFNEFLKSFECYRQTKIFEDAIERKVLSALKPLVLTEGQTDVQYIKTALELLGHNDILEKLEIDQIGQPGNKGAEGGGSSNLDAAKKFLKNNQRRFSKGVLLLYDCDVKSKDETFGVLLIRHIPENKDNKRVTKGIENLLPTELFEDRFYKKDKIAMGDGGENIISKFLKDDLCQWVCKERRNAEDFIYFESLLVPILQELCSISK